MRYVLEGSVRRAGDQVRVNAQLIDATTGGSLWAERHDGSAKDIFAVQDKFVQIIVQALALNLSKDEQEEIGRGQTRASPRVRPSSAAGNSISASPLGRMQGRRAS